MSFPRYPIYRDSGVEWLGKVPEHWEIKKVGHVSDLIAGFAFPSKDFKFDPEHAIPLVRGDNVTEGRLRWGEKGRYWPFDLEYDKRYELEVDDIVVQMDGSKVGKNWAILSEDDLPALLVQRVTRVRVSGALPKFVYSLIANEMFVRYVDQAKTDPAVPHITMKNISDYWITLPPPAEQTAITAFLDRETTKIDELVAEQRRLMELLKEKRQAVISAAVTGRFVMVNAELRMDKGKLTLRDLDAPVTAQPNKQGQYQTPEGCPAILHNDRIALLNPDLDPSQFNILKSKPSGIEWIGDVPEHWAVIKGSLIGTLFGSEQVPEKFVVEEGDLPFIKVGSLATDEFEVESWNWFVDPSIAGRYKPRSGFVVFPKRGAAIFINKVNIIERPSLIDPNLMGWEIGDRASTTFIAYTLKARRLDELADVSTVPQINNKHIAPERFPVPPLVEQNAIVTFLDGQYGKLQTLTFEAQRAIDLLHERRSALISAAVTGQINIANI